MQSYLLHTSYLICSTVKSKPGYVYDFYKTNYDGMCDFLLDSDFRALSESRDIEFVWSVLKYFISEVVFMFTPNFLVITMIPSGLTQKSVITSSVSDLWEENSSVIQRFT